MEVVDQRKDFLRRRAHRSDALYAERIWFGCGEDEDDRNRDCNCDRDNHNDFKHGGLRGCISKICPQGEPQTVIRRKPECLL